MWASPGHIVFGGSVPMLGAHIVAPLELELDVLEVELLEVVLELDVVELLLLAPPMPPMPPPELDELLLVAPPKPLELVLLELVLVEVLLLVPPVPAPPLPPHPPLATAASGAVSAMPTSQNVGERKTTSLS